MTRIIKVLVGIVAGVWVLWTVWDVYVDYWVTTSDLRALGIDWVKPWTRRTVDRSYWIDGSQVVYSFAITEEMERNLRARCLAENRIGESTQSRSCYLAHKKANGRPLVDLELQNGMIKLYYTG